MATSPSSNSKFLLFTAVLLFGIAAFSTLQTMKFMRNAVHVQGTIVSSKQRWTSSSHGGHYYTSYLIDYTTQQGQAEGFYTADYGVFANMSAYNIGAPITVAYDPRNPSDAHPASRVNFQTPIFLTVFALIIAGVWIATYKKRPAPTAELVG